MADGVPELPGFYYDAQKKRYFPVTTAPHTNTTASSTYHQPAAAKKKPRAKRSKKRQQDEESAAVATASEHERPRHRVEDAGCAAEVLFHARYDSQGTSQRAVRDAWVRHRARGLRATVPFRTAAPPRRRADASTLLPLPRLSYPVRTFCVDRDGDMFTADTEDLLGMAACRLGVVEERRYEGNNGAEYFPPKGDLMVGPDVSVLETGGECLLAASSANGSTRSRYRVHPKNVYSDTRGLFGFELMSYERVSAESPRAPVRDILCGGFVYGDKRVMVGGDGGVEHSRVEPSAGELVRLGAWAAPGSSTVLALSTVEERRVAVYGQRNGTVSVADLDARPDQKPALQIHAGAGAAVTHTSCGLAGGSFVLVAGLNDTLKLYDLRYASSSSSSSSTALRKETPCVMEYGGYENAYELRHGFDVDYSGGRTFAVSSGRGDVVNVYDIWSGELLETCKLPGSPVCRKLAWAPGRDPGDPPMLLLGLQDDPAAARLTVRARGCASW